MNSINDWAAKAAEKIYSEMSFDGSPREERIAAIIATFAEPLVTLVRDSRREHDVGDGCEAAYNEDGALDYECTCGASKWNARLDAALDGLKPAKIRKSTKSLKKPRKTRPRK